MARNKQTAKKSNITVENTSTAEGFSSEEEEEEEEKVPMQGDSTANEGEDPSSVNDGKDTAKDGKETGNDNATTKASNDADGPVVEGPQPKPIRPRRRGLLLLGRIARPGRPRRPR